MKKNNFFSICGIILLLAIPLFFYSCDKNDDTKPKDTSETNSAERIDVNVSFSRNIDSLDEIDFILVGTYVEDGITKYSDFDLAGQMIDQNSVVDINDVVAANGHLKSVNKLWALSLGYQVSQITLPIDVTIEVKGETTGKVYWNETFTCTPGNFNDQSKTIIIEK